MRDILTNLTMIGGATGIIAWTICIIADGPSTKYYIVDEEK